MRAKTLETLPPLAISARAFAPAIEVQRAPPLFAAEFQWERDEAFDGDEIPDHELALMRAADRRIEPEDLDSLDARGNLWALSI